MKTPLVVVASPRHTLATATGPITVDRLHREDIVAFDQPAPTRRVTDRHLAKLGVEPRIIAECPSIDTMMGMVKEDRLRHPAATLRGRRREAGQARGAADRRLEARARSTSCTSPDHRSRPRSATSRTLSHLAVP